MKIMSKRAVVLLVFLIAFLAGVAVFLQSYIRNAATWVEYPANKHLYSGGQLRTGTIADRNGMVLLQTVNGVKKYNSDKSVRTALMQAVGDSGGNVAAGAQTAFAHQLSGWNLLGGAFHLGDGGSEVRLTLDANLCTVAYNALAGRKGTVGVYNYKTGEILCMASSPSFDPENPPDIASDPQKYVGVYMNRLFSATYTPGSVFKLVTAAAAIDRIPNINQQTFDCTGYWAVGGGRVTCPEVHGKVNFTQALADSCNISFGQIALQLGASTLQEYARKAGFNSSLSVDGIRTAAGKVDVTKAKEADLAWAGVGQYTDTANPLNFMAYVGAIANDGVRVTPRLLANSASGSARILSSGTAQTLGKMMRNDVVSNYGDSKFKGLQLCAKTGTAQLSEGEEPDSWFAGYMDRDDCPLAFVVVVENGGAGITAAGPVANKVLQAAVGSLTGK